MISITSYEEETSKVKINQLEIKCGFSFSEEYVEFLDKYNGGKPESNITELPNTEIRSFLITSFYGICKEAVNDIFQTLQIYEGRIPQKCIPIAQAEGGNLLCMNLDSDKFGYIYYWDHDEELNFEIGEIKIENLYFVATSFREFFEKIKPYDTENADLSGYNILSVSSTSDDYKQLLKEYHEKNANK
ncbi:MAG: SMI1/KNR4 family protein [Clostridiaceae bacterium]|nr:SMI1/KNR4 family protein [Clostridiaceae bacterium]